MAPGDGTVRPYEAGTPPGAVLRLFQPWHQTQRFAGARQAPGRHRAGILPSASRAVNIHAWQARPGFRRPVRRGEDDLVHVAHAAQ